MNLQGTVSIFLYKSRKKKRKNYLQTAMKLKKALRETQNLRVGCSKAAQLVRQMLDVAKRPIPQG